MRTIYKYDLRVDGDVASLDIPLPARVLHVGMQRALNVIQVWAEGMDDAPKVTKHFKVISTGSVWPEGYQHVGTVVAPSGATVWHVLESIR